MRRTLWWEIPAAVALFALTMLAVGPVPWALPFVYLAAVTPALCRIDLRERRLPNRLVLPGYAAAVLGLAAQWLVTGVFPLVALLAGAAYFLFLLLLGLAGGMGMGDVKLGGVLGLAAGLLGVMTAVISPLLAFLVGGVAALVVLLRRGRGAHIPFGPFLLLGFWAAVLLAV